MNYLKFIRNGEDKGSKETVKNIAKGEIQTMLDECTYKASILVNQIVYM